MLDVPKSNETIKNDIHAILPLFQPPFLVRLPFCPFVFFLFKKIFKINIKLRDHMQPYMSMQYPKNATFHTCHQHNHTTIVLMLKHFHIALSTAPTFKIWYFLLHWLCFKLSRNFLKFWFSTLYSVCFNLSKLFVCLFFFYVHIFIISF